MKYFWNLPISGRLLVCAAACWVFMATGMLGTLSLMMLGVLRFGPPPGWPFIGALGMLICLIAAGATWAWENR